MLQGKTSAGPWRLVLLIAEEVDSPIAIHHSPKEIQVTGTDWYSGAQET